MVQRDQRFRFIEQESGPDVLYTSVVWRRWLKTLADGQKVEFAVTAGQKGPQAENVVPV